MYQGDVGRALAIQPDGKIVVAGMGLDPSAISGPSLALVRYNSDGSLDTSFDTDGIVTTTIGTGGEALSVAIQPDGKIVAAGFTFLNPYSSDFALACFNANGSLDTSFNGNGNVTTDVAGSYDLAYSVAVQPDGKIVAAGHANVEGYSHFALARYNASFLDYNDSTGTQIINPEITLFDPDNDNMVSAAIRINGGYQSSVDTLSIDSGDLVGGVVSSWNPDTGTLTLTGSATTTDYASMLEHVKYTNSGPDPNISARTIAWTVNDGIVDSVPQATTIAAVNDSPSDISLSNSSVLENQPAGTIVGTFSATDPDVGDIHTYTLVSGDGSTNNAWFTIQDGVLKTKATFDYESKNVYDIRMRVTDSEGLWYEKPLTINVTDVNDAPIAKNFNPSPSNLNEDVATAYRFPLSGNPVEASQTLTFHIADLSSLHGTLYKDSGCYSATRPERHDTGIRSGSCDGLCVLQACPQLQRPDELPVLRY